MLNTNVWESFSSVITNPDTKNLSNERLMVYKQILLKILIISKIDVQTFSRLLKRFFVLRCVINEGENPQTMKIVFLSIFLESSTFFEIFYILYQKLDELSPGNIRETRFQNTAGRPEMTENRNSAYFRSKNITKHLFFNIGFVITRASPLV